MVRMMMRCRNDNGWNNFITKYRGRVRRVDVMPVTVREEIPYPHRLGAACPCHPRVELQPNGMPLIIHDHPWSVPQ